MQCGPYVPVVVCRNADAGDDQLPQRSTTNRLHDDEPVYEYTFVFPIISYIIVTQELILL